jgi:hypothetical protein
MHLGPVTCPKQLSEAEAKPPLSSSQKRQQPQCQQHLPGFASAANSSTQLSLVGLWDIITAIRTLAAPGPTDPGVLGAFKLVDYLSREEQGLLTGFQSYDSSSLVHGSGLEMVAFARIHPF